MGDIRRIAYDLRPPALDELGLIPALRGHANSLNQQVGLHISVQAPENSPPLPAAVEVAAYRIAMEGLTNVIHHAHATTCVLRINVKRHLEVEICDDGRGLPTDIRSGVGLSSMREVEVIGEAETGEEVISKAADLQPDVILMDIQMPDMNGIIATRRILHTSPHIGVIIVTMLRMMIPSLLPCAPAPAATS